MISIIKLEPVITKSLPSEASPDILLPLPACNMVKVKLSPCWSNKTSLSSAPKAGANNPTVRPITAKTLIAKFLNKFLVFIFFSVIL